MSSLVNGQPELSSPPAFSVFVGIVGLLVLSTLIWLKQMVNCPHIPQSQQLKVFAEFNRISSKNLEGDFYEALDQHTPRFIDLFKSKKGTIGQNLTDLMQHINWVSPDVTALRSVVLKGIPVVLGDDYIEVYKTCFDTAKEEALASVTVGVMTVVNEDAQQQGLNAVHLQPISTAIVLEGGIVMDDIRDFPQAVCLLFGLMYALHLDYPKCMANTLKFIQAVMLGLGNKTLPPKLLTLKNKLLG